MLTLEEYEKLNPHCKIMHEGVRVVYATPSSATKIMRRNPATAPAANFPS